MLRRKKKEIDENPVDNLKDINEQIAKLNAELESYPAGAKKHKFPKTMTDKVKDRYRPERTLQIRMELRNGDFKEFQINTDKDFFNFLGGSYIIDESMKKYNISTGRYQLSYHQDFCLPINQSVSVKGINEAIAASGAIKCGASTNPSTLDRWIKADVAAGIMKAQAFDEFLRSLNMKVIIILLASVLSFLLQLKASGVLDGVKLPI